jgi:hypothetical protein
MERRERGESEPDAPSLAPDEAPDRACDALPDFEEGPDPAALGPELDIPAPPPLRVSPAPCANAIGALRSNATIATEYFSIFVSYAESTSDGRQRKRSNIPDVPILSAC